MSKSSLKVGALRWIAFAAFALVCVYGARPAYAANAYAVVSANGSATITHDSTAHASGSTGSSTDVPNLLGTWYPLDETTTGQNALFPSDVANRVISVVFDRTCDPSAGGQAIAPASTNSMFSGCNSVTEIRNLDRLDPRNVVDSSRMFYQCRQLRSLDFGDWSSNKSSDMSQMFYGCSSLKTIHGTAGLVTAHATTMRSMFQTCSSLTSLDMSGWDTSNVTNMFWTFMSCGALADVNGLNDCDTSHVRDFTSVFSDCASLTSIPRFSTASAEQMHGMFSGCTGLTSVDMSQFDTSHATTFDYMLSGCTNLVSVVGCD